VNTLIGIGVYKKEDYLEILRLSVDSEKMDETWESWKKSKAKTQQSFRKLGLKTVDILVKPKELVDYCSVRGLEIMGENRAQFITHKVQQLNK
jgi:hypothetical protein